MEAVFKNLLKLLKTYSKLWRLNLFLKSLKEDASLNSKGKLFTTELHCTKNFSLDNQCGVLEGLVRFQYSSNDKNSHYREKQNLILNIQASCHVRFCTT